MAEPSSPHAPPPRAPATDAEWERYFGLRWRVLRAPWEQPPGSERDELEDHSVHRALWDNAGNAVAVGRLHLNSPAEAQIRYMAVEPGRHGQGFGTLILRSLEDEARRLGVGVIVLNARDAAAPFYSNYGYEAIGPAQTLFGQVQHTRMMKRLSGEFT
jgi:GNAT superfamily N-acetyltransferase